MPERVGQLSAPRSKSHSRSRSINVSSKQTKDPSPTNLYQRTSRAFTTRFFRCSVSLHRPRWLWPKHQELYICALLLRCGTSPTLPFLSLPFVMAGERPQPLTLPHGFHFHYTDGTPPKTPERELSAQPELPASPQAFRVRRRMRPRLRSSIHTAPLLAMNGEADVPIPTIEAPDNCEPLAPAGLQIYQPNSDKGLLSPFPPRALTAPRTPSAQRTTFDWDSVQKESGSSIVRPTSTISSLSDSSDESDADSDDRFSYGGSCTSPESDAADPFGFPSPKKPKGDVMMAQSQESSPIVMRDLRAAKKVRWTPEMDKHIWGIYMAYIQDPTVTPFKTLPGSSPPLGVCHRVAREAKKTWRGGKSITSPETGSTARKGSPDTITAERSGSTTPTIVTAQKSQPWPKTGAATRKRLRELCKRKATIAPHYQRLMKSRSPSPFNSSSRPTSRSTRMCSPLNEQTAFTRDVQIALATSTSSTMQPNGPLAQLARSSSEAPQPPNEDWNSVPSAPWASPAPIPSDVEPQPAPAPAPVPAPAAARMLHEPAGNAPSQLGSPFHYRTWGPSRSRDAHRPRATFDEPAPATISVPRLRSPIQLHGTFPANHKRRAQFQLEEELSPGGSGLSGGARAELDDIFGPEPSGSSSSRRRVRTRGFSLGDALIHGGFGNARSVSDSTVPTESQGQGAGTEDSSRMQEAARQDSLRQLGSPFAGIRSRPSRTRRHLATASLSSFVPPTEFTSIDSLLHQANNGMDTRQTFGGVSNGMDTR